MLRRQKAVLQFIDKANGEDISIGGKVFSEVLHLQPNGSTTSPVTSNVPGEDQKMKHKKPSICTRIKNN
ncbi:hypothetical protein T10_6386 [Trichinella papuae]|uniref:Uncharacterized protein n=1 Tax=Trichinella papuae TaxID=268474 RepID=A0A0V1MJN6_9BILA|nr:hypothetical protein T10_6386 [Trichinella papuae]